MFNDETSHSNWHLLPVTLCLQGLCYKIFLEKFEENLERPTLFLHESHLKDKIEYKMFVFLDLQNSSRIVEKIDENDQSREKKKSV